MFLNCNEPSTLGALVAPSSCDASLVTTTRTLPDGTTGVFVGDYQLTAADFQTLETWRQACIAQRQAAQDAELAKRAVELASGTIAPSQFSAGPGYVADPMPSVSLAVDYVNAISNPTLQQQAQQAVIQAINTNPTLPDSLVTAQPLPAPVQPVPGGTGGGTVVPGTGTIFDAGFPDTSAPAQTSGGGSALGLSLLAALLLMGT